MFFPPKRIKTPACPPLPFRRTLPCGFPLRQHGRFFHRKKTDSGQCSSRFSCPFCQLVPSHPVFAPDETAVIVQFAQCATVPGKPPQHAVFFADIDRFFPVGIRDEFLSLFRPRNRMGHIGHQCAHCAFDRPVFRLSGHFQTHFRRHGFVFLPDGKQAELRFHIQFAAVIEHGCQRIHIAAIAAITGLRYTCHFFRSQRRGAICKSLNPRTG